MITKLTVFALSAILIASIGTAPAFGQMVGLIEVTTDKDSYASGETITISGVVRDLLSGTPVSVQVIAANGNLVTIEQLTVNPDKTFSVQITSGGPLWKSTGDYTIKVLYGSSSRTAETIFAFGTGQAPSKPSPPAGPSIGVSGTSFEVGYAISGGSIQSINCDVESNSLILALDTTGSGEITATIPRGLADAKLPNGDDDDFFVLVDGEEIDHDEVATDSERTLTMTFSDGTEEVEIIGTVCVPEFGTIATLILAVAIISIIAVTAKTRLNLLPRQ